ncbi:hypothetical protein GGR57DRAFT_471696, partial [Xylariaceae sp. FL1272]
MKTHGFPSSKKIDGTTWSMLRKHSSRREKQIRRSPRRGGPWSAWNPKIWIRMRVALEVANRMLNRMVTDRHPVLETLLFGRLEYWNSFITRPARPGGNNEDKVLLSATIEPSMAADEGVPLWESPC